MPSLSSFQIAQAVGGDLDGAGDLVVQGVERLELAGAEHLSFIGNQNYARLWAASASRVALVDRSLELPAGAGRALIRVADVDLALATVLQLFAPPRPAPPPGIHPTAVVHPSARVAADAMVGPYCVLGARVVIGSGTCLHAHVTVLDDSRIGRDCQIWPGTVVRERCQIGDRCILHANVTIGADGFGYRVGVENGQPHLVKLPHIGGVRIGQDVEIGANTCVDRGKFSDTLIGDQTKIDNLCQIAHNCRIGRACVLAGQVGLAGSVTLGDGVVLGGKVAVKDHVTIGAGARLAACSAVMDDVPAAAVWGGYPARDARLALREHAAIRKLPQLLKDWREAAPDSTQPPSAAVSDVQHHP